MRLFLSKFFKTLFSFYSPRYPLKIDEKLYRHGELYYQIIAVGEQRPIILSTKEILSGKKIKECLHPDDLLLVMEDFMKERAADAQYYVKEINRDETYLLKNKNQSMLISGEEFCRNIGLIEQTNQLDACRIMSAVYFNAGRNLERSMQEQDKPPHPRVAVLQIVQ